MLQRQAKALVREKQRFRFELISIVSHELKAPLAAVEGYLNILKERSAGDNPEVYDHITQRSILRVRGMRKLIMDLLDLTRIESGQKRRRLESVNVMELARAAVESAATNAENRGVSLRLHGNAGVALTADRDEIEIILNNLISNGIKYNREGGAVDVDCAAQNQTIVIKVSDTGIGITRQDASKLFKDFV